MIAAHSNRRVRRRGRPGGRRGVMMFRGRAEPRHATTAWHCSRATEGGQRHARSMQSVLAPTARRHRQASWPRSLHAIRNLRLLFEQADATLTPRQVLRRSAAGLAVAGHAGLAGCTAVHPGIAPVMGLVLSSLPLVLAILRRRRRLKKFAKQLPDALELVARALCAPATVWRPACTWSPRKCPTRSAEFGRVYEEQNLGIPIDEALEEHDRPRAEPGPAVLRHRRHHAAADGRRPGRNPRQDRRRGPRTLQDLGPGASPDRRRPAVRHRAVGPAAGAVPGRVYRSTPNT